MRARHRQAAHRGVLQHGLDRRPAFAGTAAHDPEVLQRHRHLHRDQRVDAAAIGLRHRHRGAQVVLLEIQAIQPLALLRPLHAVAALLGEVEEVQAVACRRGQRAFTCRQLLGGVLADRLEHAETPDADALLHHDERVFDQRGQQVEHVVGLDLVAIGAHRLGSCQIEATGKHRQPLQHGALRRAEQVVRPVDQAAQRLLALVAHPAAAGEQLEAVLQAAVDLRHRHRAQPRRGQFERQRDAFQACHQFGHRRGLGLGELEVGPLLLRALDEQAHRGRARERRHAVGSRGHGQRQDRVAVLAGHAQRHAARGDDRHPRCGLEDGVDQRRRRLEQVLAVVDHQQHALVFQLLRHRLQQRPARLFAHAQHLRGLGRHERAVAQRREVDEPDAVGKLAGHLGRHLQAQPRLAQPAHAQQGDQARRPQRRLQLVEFTVTAQERGALLRQVVRHLAQGQPALAGSHHAVGLVGVGRRQEGRRADLEQLDRLRHPLEAPMAVRVHLLAGRRQRLQRVGAEQGLAAAGQAHDARRGGLGHAVHLQRLGAAGHVLGRVLAQDHRPHVQAGARPQGVMQARERRVVGTRVGHRVVGALEHQQHAVGLVDFPPAVGRQQLACRAVVRRPQRGHRGVAQRLRQLGAVDDVGQQQGADFNHGLAASRPLVSM